MEKYLTKISVNRPLVFLCGVAISNNLSIKKRDRRLILKDYITDKTKELNEYKRISYQVMPIIVDYIFNDRSTRGLSLSLLEEIVSAISYKTYIYLDSMATSYELGLFTNSNTYNDVKVLVGKGYKTRANCQIGEYIQKAHKVFYEYTVEYDEKGYLYFYNDRLPSEIEKVILKDMNEIKNIKREVEIKFTNNLADKEGFGTIYVESKSNIVSFQTNIKTLFYMIDAIIDRKKINLRKDYVSKVIKNVEDQLFANYVYTNQSKLTFNYLFNKPKINLIISNYQKDELIKHIIGVIKAIKINNKNKNFKTDISSSEYYEFKKICSSDFDFNNIINEFFGIGKKEINTIKEYGKYPELFSKKFVLKMNKKRKKMITYADNQRGESLRNIQENIFKALKIIHNYSGVSYAYKEDCSTQKCLAKHQNSVYFIKLDITKFFDSISTKILLKKICNLFINKINTFINLDNKSKVSITKHLKEVISACFYKKKIPIGFVSSPILSDIYLNDLDKMLEKSNVVITRYADDYLISSGYVNKLEAQNIAKKIERELKKVGLTLNSKKKIERILTNDGDSIKFLGINIVYVNDEKENRLTISNKYLIDTSKMMQIFMENPSYLLYDKCRGRMNYIKGVSDLSYQKLIRIFKAHTRYNDFPKTYERLYSMNLVFEK